MRCSLPSARVPDDPPTGDGIALPAADEEHGLMRFIPQDGPAPDPRRVGTELDTELEPLRARSERPDNEIGWVLPISVVVARTDDVAVAVTAVTAFSTGVAFTVVVRLRVALPGVRPGEVLNLVNPFHPGGVDVPPDGRLLVGVEYADGRRAVVHDRRTGPTATDDLRPVLWPASGRGDDLNVEYGYFLSPLPPDGPVTFVCSWPAFGIPEATSVVEHADLTTAAARSTTLWPRQPPVQGPPPPAAPEAPPSGWFAEAAADRGTGVAHVAAPYRRGTPLRSWAHQPPRIAASAAELAAKGSGSVDAVRALLNQQSVDTEGQASLGRLNSQCFLMGYEPMVVLLADRPRLDPDVRILLEGAPLFRRP